MNFLDLSDAFYNILTYCENPLILHFVHNSLRKYTGNITYIKIIKCIKNNGYLSFDLLNQIFNNIPYNIKLYNNIINKSDEDIFNRIIRYSIKYNNPCLIKWYKSMEYDMENYDRIIILSCVYNNINSIKFLYRNNIKIKKIDTFIPLHVAIYYKSKDVISLLISYDIDINEIDYRGFNVLSKTNDIDITKLLLLCGADVTNKKNHRYGLSPFENAILYSNINILEIYLTYSYISSSCITKYIFYTIKYGSIKILKFLLDKDININYNYRDKSSGPLLHCAILYNKYDMIKLLVTNMIKKGIDLNITDHNGYNALQYARNLKRIRIASYLSFYINESIFRIGSFR